MKVLKNLYKIIFLIILMIVLLFINSSTIYAGNNDVTDPKYNPAGGTEWDGWYCAESGHSYWNNWRWSNYIKPQESITKSSKDGKEWHVLRIHPI